MNDVKTNDSGQAEKLLELVNQLALELHPYRTAASAAELDSLLGRDLSFDSLSRIELVARVERDFGVGLSDRVFALAETPRDILRAVQGAAGRPAEAAGAAVSSASPGLTGGKISLPRQAETLLDVLDWHAGATPERSYVRFYSDVDDGQVLTYGDLAQQAAQVAAGLQGMGLEAGQAVALMLPTGPDYFRCFFGILMAGGVPAPMYPPARPAHIEEHLNRHAGIISNAAAPILITAPEAIPVSRLLRGKVSTLKRVVGPEELSTQESSLLQRPAVGGGDTALLQYTSGSTSSPKGVVLTHAHLLANVRAMGEALQAESSDVLVSWLPLYHDMGLIGACLGTLYHATPLVLMSPLSFLARPERWLKAIHHYKGTISVAPNFAYELCARRIDDEALSGLDLSSWRAAGSGAEAVLPGTIERFCARFESVGFRPEAIMPLYGLAESSVGLAFPPLDQGMSVDTVDRDTLSSTGQAKPPKGEKPALHVVSCGRPLPGHQIRIVDSSGRELPDRRQGRIQFQGPSATSGYFRNPEATRELFDGDWLESGDLGYLSGGQIHVTGRIKDLIIRGGRNIHPAGIEDAVGAIKGLRAGHVTAFSSEDPRGGTERLIVLAECRSRDPAIQEEIRTAIDAAVVDLAGSPPDEVVLAPPGTVLKTSSGKVRRAATREIWERGMVGRPKRALWWQVARLALSGVPRTARRALGAAADSLQAARAWAVFGLVAIPIWLSAVILPGQNVRWISVRGLLRLALGLAGIRLRVAGLENLPTGGYVLAANHTSYLDGSFLAAALPYAPTSVVKGELAGSTLARLPLSRLGVAFVERFDQEQGAADAVRLAKKARNGRPLLFFPEGTFARMPGLSPFRMGAFMAAADAGLPVVPIALRGSRSVLYWTSWFPRPGPVTITVAEAVQSQAEETWDKALELRDKTRLTILQHSGEPDLGNQVAEAFADRM